MKRILFPILALMSMAFVGVTMMGCGSEDTTPTIKVTNVKANSKQVSFTLEPTNAIRYEYSVAKSGVNAGMNSIENSKSRDFVIEGLEEGANYDIKAIAYGKDNVKSEVVIEPFLAKDGGGSKYFRRVLAFKYTGQWCVNCPLMTAALKKIRSSDPDRLNTIAVHLSNTSERPDDLEVPAGVQLYRKTGSAGLPTTQIDYREMCSSQVSNLERAIDKSIQDYYATSVVAITSKIEGNQAIIEVKAKFSELGNYKIGCAITEDGIVRNNTVGSTSGQYNDVLRAFATDPFGDDLGEVENGGEITKTYTVDLNDNWNKENLKVVAFIIKNHGADHENYANNSAECGINGSVAFKDN